MNVNLEQSLAAVVRFIQDNSEEGTQLYFDEIPENFYVPSVYFQIPYSAGRKGFWTGSGNPVPVTPPTTRKVDEGIVQLSLSFDVYFQPEAQRTKMQKFYLAWQNAKQEIQNRRL